ncbi:hypothetical protein E3T26_03380 [Cryobacterium sp. TMT1-21]|nr:hypothetical protein E3T26_03380 [Cryobacterium sp. TMT1-21]
MEARETPPGLRTCGPIWTRPCRQGPATCEVVDGLAPTTRPGADVPRGHAQATARPTRVLLGDGGLAAEVLEYGGSVSSAYRAVTGPYLDDARPWQVDVEASSPDLYVLPVTAAVGAPGLRRELVHAWAGTQYTTIIAPSAYVASSAALAGGCIVAPHSVVSSFVRLGRHVVVNPASTIGHGTDIGDYVTISPGVHVAGRCVLGHGVFLGIGAVVSSGVSVGSGTILGAGAVLLTDAEPDSVYLGIPARRVRASEDWLRVI